MKVSRILKITGLSIAAIVFVVVALFVVMLARMVSPEEAQQASQVHYDDVKDKIESVPGYAIVKEGRPEVNDIRDEIGSKDYGLSASFLVRKLPNGSTAASVAADSADLAKRLPVNEYGIKVENTPPADDGSVLLCVRAYRYLNDDGSYIPQGATDNTSVYVTAENNSPSCTDLSPS